jgi:cell division protein FtsN
LEGYATNGNLKFAIQISIVMLDLMAVRCPRCGYENKDQYRFCGMCGAVVRSPETPAGAPKKDNASLPVSGPSFLGLADDSARDAEYLLEDEPRGHGRMYLALLLLVVSAGVLVWHWRREGFPWAEWIHQRVTATSSPVNSTPSEPPVPSSPGESHTTSPEDEQPAAVPANKEVAPHSAPESQTASNAVAVPQNTAAKPTQQGQTDNADSVEPGAQQSSESASKQEEGAISQPAEVAPSAPAETAPAASRALAKPSKAEVPPTAPTPSYADKLAADGEKYLYGNGVPQNCDRAQRDLQSAARRLNSKAQSLLGAMYATGHCVTRDLPTAYRWFAKALHQDPGNRRIERDLEVLWRQMTPDERQVALRMQ